MEEERWQANGDNDDNDDDIDRRPRVTINWTFPIKRQELEVRYQIRELQQTIEGLNSQLAESQHRVNLYQNQIGELEEQVSRLRREQRRVMSHFCVIQ